MYQQQQQPKFQIDQAVFERSFDQQPFDFKHNLDSLDIFKFDALLALAETYDGSWKDFFVAQSAAEPGVKFRDVDEIGGTPLNALQRLDTSPCRVLLKRPENFSKEFKDLLDCLFNQVMMRQSGCMDKSQIVRLEATILVSSSKTTTPFHFDPEIGFFCQIEGEKHYHVYKPDVLAETELEAFYRHSVVDIAQVDLTGRDIDREHVFNLTAGDGFHQPQNAPHWVHTGASRSVSYTIVFETVESRVRSRARAFNFYQRKIGPPPSPLGQRQAIDSLKSETMRLGIPLRRLAGRGIKRVLPRYK